MDGFVPRVAGEWVQLNAGEYSRMLMRIMLVDALNGILLAGKTNKAKDACPSALE